ncbi:MAG: S1C family serine protease [Gemmataceae bacterium]
MNFKSIVLVVGGILLAAIPARLFLFKPEKKDDGIPLVSADTPLGAPAAQPDAVPKNEEPKAEAKLEPKAEPRPDATTRKKTERPDWEAVVKDCSPAVGVVEGKVGHGTGFLLTDRVLATNAHVINLEFEENLRVHFPAAPKAQHGPFKARYIWSDRKRDLAFLRVECQPMPFELELAEDYKFSAGQEVLAIGSPGFGQNEKLENAISRGLMSTNTKLDGKRFYQMNINVNPGNSGGPVLDRDGRVLGMVTAKLRDKEGIAFAVPVDDMEEAWRNNVFGAGNETTPDQSAWNRGCTVFERLVYLGDAYLGGLDAYTQAMEQAVNRGGSPNDGLRAVSKEMAPKVNVMNRIFADNLEKNLNATLDEPFIQQQDRERIRQLWQVCREMKAAFDKPSGTVATYRQKKNQLKLQFEQLIGASLAPRKPSKKSG